MHLEANGGILDHQALRGIRTKKPGGIHVAVRRWLAILDLVAGHNDLKLGRKALLAREFAVKRLLDGRGHYPKLDSVLEEVVHKPLRPWQQIAVLPPDARVWRP